MEDIDETSYKNNKNNLIQEKNKINQNIEINKIKENPNNLNKDINSKKLKKIQKKKA